MQFRKEHAWMISYDSSKRPPLFLGFEKSATKFPHPQTSSSYIRFLCLWYILESPDYSPFTIDSIADLVTEISKALSGFQELFDPPTWELDLHLHLYERFLQEQSPEEHKILALRNIADLYRRLPVDRTGDRTIIHHSASTQSLVASILMTPATGFENVDFLDAKLCIEGTLLAVKYSSMKPSMYVNRDVPVQELKILLQARQWVRRLRLAVNHHNVGVTTKSRIGL
jgi:hypothetical protein